MAWFPVIVWHVAGKTITFSSGNSCDFRNKVQHKVVIETRVD